jgi:hypothetical protein
VGCEQQHWQGEAVGHPTGNHAVRQPQPAHLAAVPALLLPGLPATIALLATLSQAGHGKAETATAVALGIMPWTFKFIWAPIIDSVRMPSLGIRRS